MSNKRCNVCANPMEVEGYSRMDEHTIFYCPKCGNKEIVKDADIPLPKHKQSLFDRLTQSPEVLADEFVGMMYDRVSGDYRYYSMLTGEFYNNREEAIAATVTRLKEKAE